jgi:hypothetical protein
MIDRVQRNLHLGRARVPGHARESLLKNAEYRRPAPLIENHFLLGKANSARDIRAFVELATVPVNRRHQAQLVEHSWAQAGGKLAHAGDGRVNQAGGGIELPLHGMYNAWPPVQLANPRAVSPQKGRDSPRRRHAATALNAVASETAASWQIFESKAPVVPLPAAAMTTACATTRSTARCVTRDARLVLSTAATQTWIAAILPLLTGLTLERIRS